MRMPATIALVGVVVALAACAPTSTPIPQGTTTTTGAPAAPAAAVSTCDAVREAILTGTPAQITKAMTALVADKAAPATAREYARYYTGRDKADPAMREADVALIQMACV